MLYSVILFLHSWIRWALLLGGSGAVVLAVHGAVTGRRWSPTDRAFQLTFVSCMDLQFLLGLALYAGVSPFVPHNAADFKAAMHVPQLRFFAVEHVTVMLLALVVIHVSSVVARRATTDVVRHRRWAAGLFSAFLLILLGIPWAGLVYGRPLIRGLS